MKNLPPSLTVYYKKRRNLQDTGHQFVYIDETWIETAYPAKRCWQSSDTGGILSPCNRGQWPIVVHAGYQNDL